MKHVFLALSFFLAFGGSTMMAGACPPNAPTSRADGTVPAVVIAAGTQYYFKDALLAGFVCFEQLSAWFPSYITSSGTRARIARLLTWPTRRKARRHFLKCRGS